MFKIENSTGLSIEEMNAEQDKLAERTIEAMKLRSIDRPKVSNPFAVRVQECEQTFAWYRLPSYSKKKGLNNTPVNLEILESISLEKDDRLWWHISFTRQDRLIPTYSQTNQVRKAVFGDRWCIQVFPGKDEHVNDHTGCLHLWHCLDGEVLPDFRKFGTI
jgi:hypothetical protein